MPLYEFVCDACGLRVEKLVGTFTEALDAREPCPNYAKCASPEYMRLVPSAPSFKIEGFNAGNGYSKG